MTSIIPRELCSVNSPLNRLPRIDQLPRSVIDEPIAAASYWRNLVGKSQIQPLGDGSLLIVAIGSG
jgi:hypothetical protein